jgi:DNA repair protein RadC
MLKIKSKIGDFIVNRALSITAKKFEDHYDTCDPLQTAEDMANHIYLEQRDSNVETFYAYYIDMEGFIIDSYTKSGSKNSIQISNKEILQRALACDAHKIIVAHTHIAQSHEPSDSDILFTYNLIKAAGLLDMVVYDHIVVSRQGWTSMNEQGYIENMYTELLSEKEEA